MVRSPEINHQPIILSGIRSASVAGNQFLSRRRPLWRGEGETGVQESAFARNEGDGAAHGDLAGASRLPRKESCLPILAILMEKFHVS